MNDAPEAYRTAGLFMIIAGAMNLMQGAILMMVAIIYVISTCGILCMCLIPPIFPLVAGILELVMGIRMQGGQRVPEAQTVSIVGLVSAILGLAMIPMVMEILVLVFLGKPEVKQWLAAEDGPELIE